MTSTRRRSFKRVGVDRRTSRCERFDGDPKKAWRSRKHAIAVLDQMRGEGRQVGTLVPYLCNCGMWHLGNIAQSSFRKPRRVVDREPSLLVELGERACVMLLIESSPSKRGRRKVPALNFVGVA